MISLVMTTYNGEKYIIEQLDSILSQSVQPDEVLIFDDGSVDQTVILVNDYIKRHKLSNWKIHVNKENLGFNKNFRHALNESNGDIVFLCDQDDIWMKDKIEKIMQHLNRGDILSLASDFVLIDENGKNINSNDIRDKYGMLDFNINEFSIVEVSYEDLLMKNYAQGCTMAVKRELIQLLRQDETNNLEHDWSLSLIAAIHNGCYFYKEPLIKYRVHSDNAIGLDTIQLADKKRMKSREDVVSLELQRILFSLQYANQNDKIYQDLKFRKEYYELRIQLIQKRKVFSLLSLSLFSKYRKLAKIRPILGDITSILKKY